MTQSKTNTKKVTIDFVPSRHLSQIYDGFAALERQGLLDLRIRKGRQSSPKAILKVRFDYGTTIIYDMLDGFNWIDGSTEQNLEYFTKTISADYYFKRSYSQILNDYKPPGCLMMPLGLYAPFHPRGPYPKSRQQWLEFTLSPILKFLPTNSSGIIRQSDLEYCPAPLNDPQILFVAKLWDPARTADRNLKKAWQRMNDFRIACVETCKREFGELFMGGIQSDSYSIKIRKDLVLPRYSSKRGVWLRNIKASAICVATTGLHNSIGAKFGEYVAASRAIVSEPLHYQPPGPFRSGRNYIEFDSPDLLVKSISELLTDKNMLSRMMLENQKYYNSHMRSDILVLRTLMSAQGLNIFGDT